MKLLRFFIGGAIFFGLVAPIASADMAVQACFSPQGKCSTYIVREIENARRELLVAVYAFTSDDLAGALVQAKKRGLMVQVIIDREFDSRNEKSKANFWRSREFRYDVSPAASLPIRQERLGSCTRSSRLSIAE